MWLLIILFSVHLELHLFSKLRGQALRCGNYLVRITFSELRGYSLRCGNYLVPITFRSFLMIKKLSIKFTIYSVSAVVQTMLFK